MIKAIFFDIDGTLLSFKTHKMPKSTREALNILKDKNIKLFIATGRPPKSLKSIEHILDFEFDGYITLNGQYCIVDDKVVYESCLPLKSIEAVLPYMQKKRISSEFVELDYIFINNINSRVIELKNFLGNTEKLPPIDTSNRIYENKVYQLCTYITEDEEKEFFEHMPECKGVRWNPLFLDVIPKNGGKPIGIQKILEYLGISMDECMAFGDGGNDIDMLKAVKVGVAMGNALDNVKAAADYVTNDVDDDGIIHALEHYEII